MIGISSYGAYIPFHRLDRSEFFRAWGGIFGMAIPGEKAVANFDEDSITMAVESTTDCLNGTDPHKVDGLFFATTTSPYKDRLCAGIMSMVLDLRRDARTMDVTGTLRSGTTAMVSALDAIKAGQAKNILVASADTILAAPAGDFEQAFGDGSAALLLSNEKVIASIEGHYSISDEFSGMWRTSDDTFVRAWEDRMIKIQSDYAAKGVQFIAINANDAQKYPDDSFPKMKERASEKGFNFPYLYDETQEIARAYGAERTPEVFLFDKNGTLRYHGAIDDNYDDPSAVQSQYLREALDAVLADQAPPTAQTPPVGCTIKWK